MLNHHHQELLTQIKNNSKKGTSHTFSDSYLGNTNPRYAIAVPALRNIARTWMSANKQMSAGDFVSLLTSLISGASSTEKSLAGILLGYSTKAQREFDPALFDQWLDQLEGWAEIDAVCTGPYTVTHIVPYWKKWKPLLVKFSKDKSPAKQRASLVLLTSCVRYNDDDRLAEIAFDNIERLKNEKSILITRAISWLLRSLIKLHRPALEKYLKSAKGLPAIAVRETNITLKTGKKTSGRPPAKKAERKK